MLGLAIWFLSQFMGDQVPDDGAGACAEVELVASRGYSPTAWSDATVDTDAITFTIPDSLPVTMGNAGNKRASLSFSHAGGATVECDYEGGSPVAHPTSPADVLLGQTYVFDSCDDGSIAGEQATADHFELHVHNGDSWVGPTEVNLTLGDAACVAAAGPCADGSWGGITWLGQTAHVRADGDDANDGTAGAPVATIDRALEITRSWGAGADKKAIAVGPGTFSTSAVLDQPEDDDTWIMGCSPAETILVGADPTRSVVELALAEEGVKSLSIEGGRVGLRARDGAEVWLNDVAVVSTGESGVRLEGASTLGWFRDVEVTDPVGDSGCGWGIAVDGATVISLGGAIRGAQEVGLGAIDSTVVMLEFEVEGTAQNGAGMLGRGVHTQGGWTLLGNGRVVDNFDAGVFLLNPTGGVILGIDIEFTSAGITAAGGATGDGVVVAGARQAEVLVVRNVFTQNVRGGVVIDDSDVKLTGNMSDAASVWEAVQQNSTVSGNQAGFAVDLSATPIDLEKAPLTCTF